jgi:hypothetical protein
MEDVESDDAARDRLVLGESIREVVPPQTRRMLSWYTTTPTSKGIRSGADTFATIMGT